MFLEPSEWLILLKIFDSSGSIQNTLWTSLLARNLTIPVHCTCTHGQKFPFGFLGPGKLDPRLHTGSRFSFQATTVVRPSQTLTVSSGVPFVFDEDENRENKKSLILY